MFYQLPKSGGNTRMAEWFSYEDIDRTGANWRIIYGERSNGKTYGSKIKMIDNYFERGKKFAYLRRRAEEIKISRVSNYFTDVFPYLNKRAMEALPGFHNFLVVPKAGEFILTGVTNNGEKKKIDVFGNYFSLTQSHYEKSTSFPDTTMIVFDEFLCRPREEIPDELPLLTNFVSTITRKRSDMVVYLLGNTINRSSQLLASMNIDIRRIKQGEIRVFDYFSGKSRNTVAVQYCRHYEHENDADSFTVFGKQRERMITLGEWETGDYPTFNIEDFNRWKTAAAFVLFGSASRVYAYLTDESMLYVTASRQKLPPGVEYIVIDNRDGSKTDPTRRTLSGAGAAARSIKDNLERVLMEGRALFEDNETGFDFEALLKPI